MQKGNSCQIEKNLSKQIWITLTHFNLTKFSPKSWWESKKLSVSVSVKKKSVFKYKFNRCHSLSFYLVGIHVYTRNLSKKIRIKQQKKLLLHIRVFCCSCGGGRCSFNHFLFQTLMGVAWSSWSATPIFFLHLGALAAFEFDFRLMRISQKKFVFLPITAAMVVF